MPKKILLADDSITIQKVVELTFSDGDYEVIATNNGTRAIEKLEQVRPDIILSDIIMPEKNGYEVCEFVKSHPEYRSIPVILLTGTFEPFDPDRAEKAGCDAVVTKPFESQGLIQKVEQLIQQAGAPASAAPPPPAAVAPPPPSPLPAETSPFDMSPAPPPTAESSPFEDEPPAPAAPPQEDLGETKLIPKFRFDDFQKPPEEPPAAPPAEEQPPSFEAPAPPPPPVAAEPEPQPAPEPVASEPESIPFTRPEPEPEPAAVSQPEPELAPAPPAPPASAPEPAAEEGGETRIIPKMTFDDLQRMREEALQAEPEPAPPQPEAPLFDEEPPLPPPAATEPPPFEAASEPGERAPFEADTSLRSTVNIPSLSGLPLGEEPMSEVAGEAPPAEEQPFGESQAPEEPVEPEMAAAPAFEEPEAEEPVAEEPAEPEKEPEPLRAVEPEAEPEESVEPTPFAEPEPASAAPSGALSDADVDRIARRVVELMSDKAIRDIAWEVIPDLAEIAVRERIRELESEE